MRFLSTALVSLALIGSSVEAVAKRYRFDIAGDNSFKVYVSKAGTNIVTPLIADADQKWVDGRNAEIQTGWSTPSRYTGLELDDGDVLSVYVQNIDAAVGSHPVGGNPSAIVGRLVEIDSSNVPLTGHGHDIPTNQFWNCAYRTENVGSTGFDPARFLPTNWIGNRATDWASAVYSNPDLGSAAVSGMGQTGDAFFHSAFEVSSLYNSGNIWSTTTVDGHTASTIVEAIPNVPASYDEPFWIYAIPQLARETDPLVHHGWCRYRIGGGTGFAPPGGNGDPVFSGFQGQEFQFHGLPDEHFNLISSPQVQLNAHFVYLSAGKCDYTDTACWTHPGTYMDVMGFSIGETRVKVVAGSHADGLRVWVNDAEVPRNTVIPSLAGNVTSTLRYSRSGKVHIHTDLIDYTVINSDMFMNLQAAMKSSQLLSVGAHKHTVTDSNICHTNTETHNHQLIESTVSKKYPMTTQLHGLIGQTWRNVKVCGRDWMGTVQDYVTESLFGTTYHYNYFGKSA